VDKNYLLTYEKFKKAKDTNERSFVEMSFAWFDTENELWEYVDTNDVEVIEAFKINDIKVISE